MTTSEWWARWMQTFDNHFLICIFPNRKLRGKPLSWIVVSIIGCILLTVIRLHSDFKYSIQGDLLDSIIKREELNSTLSIAGTPVKGKHLPPLPKEWTLPPYVSEFLSQPVINPHPYGYFHNQVTKCGTKRTKLLFVIPSAPANFDRRQRVRDSILRAFVSEHSANVSLLFFLGFPSYKGALTSYIQRLVNWESQIFSDIVQSAFTDEYDNLRLKAQLMLKWASTYCYNATYVIRSDDDVIFDVKTVVNILYKYGENLDFIMGSVKTTLDWRTVDRSGKNQATYEEYPDKFWPPFALGGLQGYPLRTARLLYEASLRQRAVRLEDVYITGMCAPRVNVKLVDDKLWTFVHRSY